MSLIGNPLNSVAFLTDQFSGNGSTVAFTMSVAPANTASVLVAITGVVQDPSTYSVVGTTLTFSAAPPSGTGNISVRYLGIPASGVTTTAYRTVTEFTATSGQTSFSVPSYTIGYIDVFRNGVRLGAADYTASSGTTVVLAAAATLGDLIVTESFYVSSVLNAIPATAGAVNSTYLADSAITAAKLAAGVARANWGAGGILQVVSTNSASYVATTSTTTIDSGISLSITPTSATSKILCFIEVNGLQRPAGSSGGIKLQLVRNSTAILNFEGIAAYAPGVASGEVDVGGSGASFLDSPATTSSTTYKLYFASGTGGNVYINNYYDGSHRSATSITLMEIAA